MQRRPTSLLLCVALLPLLAGPRLAQAGARRQVPEVIDLPVPAAQAELAAGGFSATVEEIDGEPAGTVGRQEPGGFAWAEAGGSVKIFVRRGGAPGTGRGPADPQAPFPVAPPSVVPPSAAPPSVSPPVAPPPPAAPLVASSVPVVIGHTEAEALDLLHSYRVTVTGVEATAGNEGLVVDQSPAGGQPLAAGQSVTISVGRVGAPPAGAASVPDVVGLDPEAAKARLAQAHLAPLVNLVAADPASAGKVVAQEPPAGVVVARDSNVMLSIGRPAATPLTETEVPDLIHASETEARKRLAAAGLEASVKDRLAPAPDADAVLQQEPAPGTRLPRGRIVTLTVGRLLLLPLRLPDTLGQDAATAEKALADAGFTVLRATALSLPGSAGKVVAQDPAGGGMATRSSTVRITIGQPPGGAAGSVAVPSVIGTAEAQARADLTAAGFTVRTVPVGGPPAVAGRVQGQSPGGGASVPRGSEVVIQVVPATGPAATPTAVPVPGYVGGDAAAAQSDLLARGLGVVLAYIAGTPEGRVVGQDPAPGTPLAPGSRVTLTVSRAPTLPQVQLREPATGTALPRNVGMTYYWEPVPEAEDYQFEIFVWKDDTWVQADNDIERAPQKHPSKNKKGTYQWHVRARRAGGKVLGPWSEWRRVTIY